MSAPSAAGKWTRVRLCGFGVGFAVLFFAVGTRAFNLQIRERDELRAKAEEQYLREIELPPRRGRILDRKGAELAATVDVDSIYCNPRQLPDPADAARKLARVLGLPRRDLEKKLTQRRYFAWVKRRVSPDEAAAARALKLPGVAFAKEPRRVYPNKELAATVMGHAGSDGRGLDGIELTFDRQLRGRATSVQGLRDALGRELFIEGVADSSTGAGADVVLTVDKYVTYVTERALEGAVARHRAKAAVAVVMDPRTGEILALASAPSYNPNDPAAAVAIGARNRAITDALEPGSTMKVFTIASALEAGAVRPDDRFDCQMGTMMVGKYQIHDTHHYGMLTTTEVLKLSSNIGATKIARRLGRERLAEGLARFGFGRPSGVTLPGERAGIIRPVARWGDIGFSNVAFGQGLTVTPLQLAAGVGAIAGGGVYRAPRVVSRVVQADGRTEAVSPSSPDARVVSEATARAMAAMMRTVTEPGGTAKQAAIEGYPVAGKTGTAQKVSNGRYDPDKWTASFVGFAPAQDPRVVIAVLVDEPRGEHRGGAVAAPVFREIGEQVLRYLHVAPEAAVEAAIQTKKGDVGRKMTKAAVAASAPAAEAAPEGPGSDLALAAEDALGEGIAECEEAGETGETDNAGPETGDVVAVPDFTGMSVGQAIRAARRSGVELLADGGGVALRQSPAPGPAARGVLARVTFGRRP